MADDTVNITLIVAGNREDISLPEGATHADVLAKVEGSENLSVKSRGEDLSEDPTKRVESGQRVTATPRDLKNGQL